MYPMATWVEQLAYRNQVGFVTSLPIDKPISIIDEYGYRSDIENQGFRELKQGWMIEKFPTKQGSDSPYLPHLADL